MKNKKKVVFLSIMVVLLVASAVLNVWLNQRLGKTETPVDGGTPTVAATFNSIRSERTSSRQETFEYIDAILSSESSSDKSKASAERQKQSILDMMTLETLLESRIKSKGFGDVLVTLGEDSCAVAVADDDLQADEVAQIFAIVTGETDYSARQIEIWPY